MKARLSLALVIAVTSALLPLAGCTQQAAQSATLITTAQAEPAAIAETNPPSPTQPAVEEKAVEPAGALSAAAPTPEPAPAVVETVVAPEPVPVATRVFPTNLRTNSPALDVVKMAQSGVAETVMLTFITNTSSMFLLSADEIVYLNDIGVPSEVVTAMMQRDMQLRQFWANAQTAAAPAPVVPAVVAEAEAAAPSYVNPPAAEVQPAPTEPTVVNNNYFYETLSPYGTWVDIEGYGRCWQPTIVVANRNWRPYSDGGRWVYTDAGWYWLSDYSWGATTFHYGRWFNHARWGWCWWPDTVWGPSWVTFRYSGDYCGWAPLPPHAYYRTGLGFSYYGRSVGFGFDFGLSSSYFTFVTWNRFCDPRPWHHRARHHDVERIYNNTTVVNNYVTGDNNTIINRGIGADRVRNLGRTEVKTVKLRDEGVLRSGGGVRRERLDRDGRTLVVNRPLPQVTPGDSKRDPSRESRPVSLRSGNDVTAAGGVSRPIRPADSVRPTYSTPSTRSVTAPAAPDSKASVTTSSRSEGGVARSREWSGAREPRPTRASPIIVNGPATGSKTAPLAEPAPVAPLAKPAPIAQPAPITRPATRAESAPLARPAAPAPIATPAQPAAPSSGTTRPQRNSVIVVGKSMSSPSTAQRSFPVYSSPQRPAPATRPAPVASTPAAPSVSASSAPTAPAAPTRTWTPPSQNRQEFSAPTRSFSPPTRSERPSFSPRVSTPTVRPSYAPPAVSAPRSVPSPAPAPSIAPRPSPPAPSVSAPRPAPAPAPSRPSAPPSSAPSRSESGNRRGR